jgi:endonuclease YncB( thermonuclease family)
MKFLLLILLLVTVMIAGCTQTTPLTWICPNGTEVLGGPSQCPEASFCKGYARCFNGTVTRLVDGDTLEVNNVSIRLALVDAPEYNEEGGSEAKEFASSVCLIGSKAIVDEDDGQIESSYGRIVAVVYCERINLNARMVTNKYVTVDKRYCNVSEFANEDWAWKFC